MLVFERRAPGSWSRMVHGRRALTIVALGGAFAIFLAWLFAPVLSWTFDSSAIQPELGSAYTAVLPRKPSRFYYVASDAPDAPHASRLSLYEDGKLLGPAHAQHASIRTSAAGAYSHWGGHVLFSASDGSDPRRSGRSYRAETRMELRTEWRLLGAGLLTLAVFANLGAFVRWAGSFSMRRIWSAARHQLMSRAWLIGLLAASVIVCVAISAAALKAPSIEVVFDMSKAQSDSSAAYVLAVDVPPTWLYRLESDDSSTPRASTLTLYEDGRALGPPHAIHDVIRKAGRGSYSHWGGHLFASTSDNSDPRHNGRGYRATARLALRPAVAAVGWVAILIALASVAGLLHITGRSHLLQQARLGVVALVRGGGSNVLERPGAVAAAIAAGVTAAVVLVITGWYAGDATTSGAEVVRYLPVSDALGYHSCASALASLGDLHQSFGGEWCSRRILYAAMLASILKVTPGSDAAFALILQGGVAGLSVAVLAMRAARTIGAIGAAIASAVLFVYAWEFVFGLFMTEVAGFSLSLLGLVLLLEFSDSRRLMDLLLGSALISIAMAARAGALLVLPAMAIWALFAVPNSRSWRALAVAVAGLSVGAVMQIAVVTMAGFSPSNTGGNFASSLYGLAIGSRQWSDVYRDFGPLFEQGETAAFQHIYRVSLQEIAAHPQVFTDALAGAGLDYLRSVFRFGALDRFHNSLNALAALGLIACAIRRREPTARLFLALAAGECLSAPLIIDSGGIRVFGSTILVRALLCGAGAQLVMQVLLWMRERPASDLASSAATTRAVALWVGSLLTAGMIVSVTPITSWTRKATHVGLGCPDGLTEVVARIGEESQALTFTTGAGGLESVRPFRVGLHRFVGDERLSANAFGEEVLSIERPLTILRAVDLGAAASGGRVKLLFYRGELPPSSVPKSLCVETTRSVKFVNYPHLLIRLVRDLPAQ